MGLIMECFKPKRGNLVKKAAGNKDMILTHPEIKPTHTLIFLPGYSQTPEDFADWYFNIKKSSIPKHFRLRLVRSPIRKITASCFGSEKEPAWFDFLKSKFDKEDFYDKKDLHEMNLIIQDIIKEEAKVMGDFSKVFVAGFS